MAAELQRPDQSELEARLVKQEIGELKVDIARLSGELDFVSKLIEGTVAEWPVHHVPGSQVKVDLQWNLGVEESYETRRRSPRRSIIWRAATTRSARSMPRSA